MKTSAHLAAQHALQDYLDRNRIAATVEAGVAAGRWRVRYEIADPPQVTIIMPSGGRMEFLRPCLESLFGKTEYPHYEVMIVDNSKDDVVRQYVTRAFVDRVIYVDRRHRGFNFSELNNTAVRQASAPLVLFLNDDIEVVNHDWLTAMVEHGQRPQVGAVGAKLLYPFGRIQHAGVVMGLYENTAHAFKHFAADDPGYFYFPQMVRDCSAVTAACMLTKRELFLRMGGFDEKGLAVAFQDVDYCLRLCQAGVYVVYTPYAVLVHHESVTKDEKIGNPKEVRYMRKKWADVIAEDPFYNPNLTRRGEDYAIRLE